MISLYQTIPNHDISNVSCNMCLGFLWTTPTYSKIPCRLQTININQPYNSWDRKVWQPYIWPNNDCQDNKLLDFLCECTRQHTWIQWYTAYGMIVTCWFKTTYKVVSWYKAWWQGSAYVQYPLDYPTIIWTFSVSLDYWTDNKDD